MLAGDQVGLLPGGVAGAVGREHEAADAMAAEVVGDQVALPALGKVPAAEDLQAAILGTAGVQALQEDVQPRRPRCRRRRG